MKKFIDFCTKYNLIYYALIFLVSFIIVSPIITDYIFGHDSAFHISNIQAIKTAIRTNNWYFPKVLPLIAKNFGYATPMFYGPLPHFCTVFISEVIGFVRNISILHVMSFIHFLTLFLSGTFMFQFSNKLIKNKYLALLSSIIYITFPYHLSEIFVRDAYAESMTFMFIPLIFNGLYELLYNKNNKKFYTLFIIGVAGLVLTHTIITMFTTIIVVIYLLINYKRTFNKNNIRALFISLGFILGITSFYLFPLLEQKVMGNYHVFNMNSMSTTDSLVNYALTPKLLLPFANSKSSDGIQFFILIPVICLFIYTILSFGKLKDNHKGLYLFYIISGCLLLFMTTKFFPWKIIPNIFTYIQFPWRLLVFVSFFISFTCILCLKQFKDIIIKISSFVFIILILSLSISSVNLERVMDYTPDGVDISTFGVGATNEYFPEKIVNNFEYYQNRTDDIIVLSGDKEAKIEVITRETPYLKFKIECKEDTLLELPLIYYYGYGANIAGRVNSKNIYLSSMVKENERGFINLKIPEGTYTVIVDYNGTKLQQVCNIISIFSFIIFASFIMKGSSKYEKK